MKQSLLLFVFLMLVSSLYSQNTQVISDEINWSEQPIHHNPYEDGGIYIYSFEGALYSEQSPSLPLYSIRIPLSGKGILHVQMNEQIFSPFIKHGALDDIVLNNDIKIKTVVEKDRDQYYGKIFFYPIIKTPTGEYQKLESFKLNLRFEAEPNFSSPRNDYTYESALAEGNIYKIQVSNNGIQKIDYNFLKNNLDINIDEVDPKTIQIFGNGQGVLPEAVDFEQIDDLAENAIYIEGEGDGVFNTSDYILFYGNSGHTWSFNSASFDYSRRTNIYTDYGYYFIKIGSQNGRRVTDQQSLNNSSYVSSESDYYDRFEEIKFNLLDQFSSASGSGKQWYGDHFDAVRSKVYTDVFNVPNIISTESAKLKVGFATRRSGGPGASSQVYARVGGQQFSRNFSGVSTDKIETNYASAGLITGTFTSSSENISVEIDYPNVSNGNSEGWLDYIEINARRNNILIGDQIFLSDFKTLSHTESTFAVGNISSDKTMVWNVSDPTNVENQIFSENSGSIEFSVNTTTLKTFAVFDPRGTLHTPTFVEKTENQNYHAYDDVDFLIIYHKDFEEQAIRLADHRRDFNNYNVALAEIGKVYNEFSSGAYDLSAIRDFAKMLFDRSDRFKYLLLVGDGSFDYRNILELESPQNFIPTYETAQSLHPIYSFPSDDFFSLLTEGEGDGDLRGAVDIAVGRIPVNTNDEFRIVVDKLIEYDQYEGTLGDWRNKLTFIADDEDNNTHFFQTDRITEDIVRDYPNFNLSKVYLDAFRQQATPGGSFYPDVNDAVRNNFFKGHLLVNYLGHGGPKGWAHERVLTFNDITSWTNSLKYPLFVTATCSFTGYDDPKELTAGERVLLKENGGAIGLFTTVRAVFSSSNERLTRAVFDEIFEKVDGNQQTLGDIIRAAKNANSADTSGVNARKFALIGDPSMHLAIPKMGVATTAINGNSIISSQYDTIKAQQTVTIDGEIIDTEGNLLSSFNGKVFPTIYDKEINVKTLGQDPKSLPVQTFKQQQNIIFKGVASVTNGKFSFSFVVPKDINYEFGAGKISYYAHDNVSLDATGNYQNLIIGGIDTQVAIDDQGPEVEVYMNTEEFVLGGITDANPTLLVILSDDNGINVVGNSIGHDLTAVLDGNDQNSFLLNDFYESELDNFKMGKVKYPLKDLEVGTHTIKVKAWDTANNSAEGYTEFIVVSSASAALDHVLNYPNPFVNNTDFMFEHNLPNQFLNVQIQIFSASGRLVKTIQEQKFSEGYRVNDINWDGKDDFGDDLAKGVYIYKVKVGTTEDSSFSAETESDFEKLVILK